MGIFDKSKLAQAAPSSAESKPLIMIVDDEEANLQVLTSVLEDKFSLIKAENGQDALGKILALPASQPLRAVLADQRMPVMSGTELLERVRDYNPNVVRILITGYTDLDSMVDSINRAQIYRYISKPFNTQDLLLTVERAVESVELREAKEKAEAEAKANLERMNEALSSANALKNLFLATVSHELRTPMHGVVGNLELLNSPLLHSEIRPHLDEARDSALQIRGMLDDILLFAEIQAGNRRLSPADVCLRTLIETECKQVREACAEKQLAFDCQIAPSVPEHIHTDSALLVQILRYLLSNAIKFTDTGRITLALDIKRDSPVPCPPLWDETDIPAGQWTTLQVRVIDSGIGIDCAQQAALFESFNQANMQFNRRHGGLGLGLALCKQLTTLFQGQTHCESTPGKGSSFEVLLPVFALDARREAKQTSSLHLALAHKPRVLVVDDNQVNRNVIETMLKRIGCETHSAENGVGAVSAASSCAFDMILMDCQMPVMDGFTATEEIKSLETHRNTPIVAFTANAAQSDRDRAKLAGMCDLLQKPVTLPELFNCLSKWLGLSAPDTHEAKQV